MILHALFSGIVFLTGSTASPDAFDKSLALVPPDAGAICAIPNLGLLNNDLGALIDGTNQPAAVLAGRPIEMMKALLGFGAGFDESGSMLLWLQKDPGGSGEVAPVYLVPASDPQSFLTANFTADGTGWRNNQNSELLFFARPCANHLLLSPVEQLATSYEPADGSMNRVRSHLSESQAAHLAKADLLAWIDGPTSRFLAEQVKDMARDVPFSDRDSLPPAVESAFQSSLVLVDVDPLGLSVRKFTAFDPASEFGALLKGGPSSGAPLDRLPLAPFYMAFSVDVAALGGMPTLHRIFELLGGSSEDLPKSILAPELEVDSIQGAIYPSRLGIALGGFLNDSALIMSGPDPQALEDHFHESLESLDGERGGIRYETTWVDDKPLRTGGVSDAFQMKETVLPPSQRTGSPRISNAAIQRMFTQFIFGSRGLAGFAGTERDAFILTFSQRPDVWNRALEASNGTSSGLGKDPVLASMRSWLMEDPDIEFAIGFGTFGKLLGQLARSFPMIEPDQVPQIPEGTPPVVVDLGYRNHVAEMAVVVPTGVIALGVEQAMKSAAGAAGLTSPRDGKN